MLTSCSIDFPYTALVYSNEPPGPNAFLIPTDRTSVDLPYADPCNFPSVCFRLMFPVSCFPSPVFRLLFFALCAISKSYSALHALQILSDSGFPKQGNFVLRFTVLRFTIVLLVFTIFY